MCCARKSLFGIPILTDSNMKDGFMTRICIKCNIEKPIVKFFKNRRACNHCYYIPAKANPFKIYVKDGIKYRKCKTCIIDKNVEDFPKNGKFYKGICKSCKHEAYRLKHPEKTKEEKEESKRQSQERRRVYLENWKNSGGRNKIREYKKLRYKTDINFKLQRNISRRIAGVLKRVRTKKSDKSLKLVNCTIQFLKEYIQSKFTEGMNWQNHGKGNGKWAVDHIIPCEAFNLTNPKHQKICFHYTNLQPLWDNDNTIKSDKLPDGRKCRDLSPKQKLDYLRSLGYNL